VEARRQGAEELERVVAEAARDVKAKRRALLASRFDPVEWLELIEITAADVVEAGEGPRVVPADPDDDPYLWTAYVGAATHVVTWDVEVLAVKHFHRAQVVDPAEFLRQLRARPA
jgi:predicted nucleic acid-binding protein